MRDLNVDKVACKLQEMASKGYKEVGILRDTEYGLEVADIATSYNNAIVVDKVGIVNLEKHNTKEDIQNELTLLLKNYIRE